jgi:hypothetical protein
MCIISRVLWSKIENEDSPSLASKSFQKFAELEVNLWTKLKWSLNDKEEAV